jgi:PAS domain S-box-containing protein
MSDREVAEAAEIGSASRLPRLAPLGLAAAVALLAGSSLLGYRSTAAFAERARWMDHTHRVIEEVEQVRALAARSGSEAHGYVLEGDDSLLQALSTQQQEVSASLQRAASLVADNHDQQRRIETLTALIEQRWALMEAAVEARRRDGDATRALAEVARAQPLAIRIHEIADRIRSAEEHHLAELSKEARRAEATARLLIPSGSVLSIILFAGAFGLLLREAKARGIAQRDLDRIFNLSQDLLCVASGDGYFRRVNPAWGALGWDEAELTARPFLDFVHPDDQAATTDAVERQLRAGQKIVSFENRYRCKDGSYRTLLWNSTPVTREGLMYGAARDINELKRADERTRAVMESAPDAMVVVAKRGRIVLVNVRTEAMFGYSRAELVGQPIELLIPERFRERHPTYVTRYLAAPAVRAMGTGRDLFGVRRDGSEFPVEIGLSPMHTEGELHVIAAIRNVTERKQSEDALRSAKEATEAANKELESFSYSVSHDLRAPLRAIDGFSRILLEEYGEKLDEEAQRLLGVLINNTGKMGQLIDDLLAFSRLGRKEIRSGRVDMHALASSALRNALADAGSKADCILHPLPAIVGDAGLLEQVWVNLISNAVKFSARAERPRIELGAREAPDEVVYWVRDNGAGFDMRYAGKLFGVFQRLHRDSEFPGTGVGLAIVQRIVLGHGGSVRAQGAIGAGATFEFSLPKKGVQT